MALSGNGSGAFSFSLGLKGQEKKGKLVGSLDFLSFAEYECLRSAGRRYEGEEDIPDGSRG